MKTIRVGVLRGGPSAEYDVSLKTGAGVLEALPNNYRVADILLSRDMQWHLNGVPTTEEKIFSSIDVVFNALHGAFGEDGKVQRLFEQHGVKYTGSRPYGSAVCMNKILAKEFAKKAGVHTAPWIVGNIEENDTEEIARQAVRAMAPPWVVKDPNGGSSIGVYIARTHHELTYVLEKLFISGVARALIEQHIKGREATCGVIEHFRQQAHYVLPVIEIVPPAERTFFDYSCKYDNSTQQICPPRFTQEEKRSIEDMSRMAFKALGCNHYGRVDFILTKFGPYFLELNTLPGLTSASSMPKALDAVGASYPDFLDHLIGMALKTQ